VVLEFADPCEAHAMPAADHDHLRKLLDEAARDLADVTPKRMFGCDALFAGGSIFALIWKTGRIGVKLPAPALHDKLMQTPGAEPWTAGDRTMSQWVLVPESFHSAPESLKHWVSQAHALALSDSTSKPARPKTSAKAKPKSKRRASPKDKKGGEG
jgi:TfoX/Sxy family transcriptional regulator of competence genes